LSFLEDTLDINGNDHTNTQYTSISHIDFEKSMLNIFLYKFSRSPSHFGEYRLRPESTNAWPFLRNINQHFHHHLLLQLVKVLPGDSRELSIKSVFSIQSYFAV